MSAPERISETVTIEGLKEIDQKLTAMDAKLATRIVKRSLKAGAKVTDAAAEAMTPRLSGKLEASLKVINDRQSRRRNYASVRVGFGKKWWTGDDFYAAFVEFGHHVGSRKLGGNRTWIPGEHMLEFAFDETARAAMSVIIRTALTLLEKVASESAETGAGE